MERSRSDTELRLALCLRGGVSLAVWMGGACREISAVAGACRNGVDPHGNASPYDRAQAKIYHGLLTLGGYERVTLDVIAGTSAGGLNGVLLATHLVYGMRFDSGVRDTWLRLGDLETLIWEPNTRPVPSLLRGDKGFYEQFFEALLELLKTSVPDSFTTRNAPSLVRLILTATRISPRTDYVRPSVGDPFPASRAAAHFRFRHCRPGDQPDVPDAFTDFPEGGRAIPALKRLAYAARTTSSFPGAFEPATPYVAGGPGRPPDDVIDLSGISSETGAPDNGDGRVRLVDGGVLDNVPLTWAVRAVAGAPADQPVDRWLLYLQPVPPPSPQKREKPRSLARLVGLVTTVIRTKLTSETILDDVAELRDAWAEAQRLRGAAGGVPGDLDRAALRDPERRRRLLPAYRDAMACMEADRLVRLLEDPVQLLGPDPLPMPPTTGPLGDGAAGVELVAQLRDQRMPALVLDPGANGDLDVTAFRSPFAPARAVMLAFDWVHAAEAAAGPEHGEAVRRAAGRARKALYGARFTCEVLVAARDRLLLGSMPEKGRLAVQWVQSAWRSLDTLASQGRADHGAAPRAAGLRPADLSAEDLGHLAHAATTAAPSECRDAEAEPDWAVSLLEPVWTRVARICHEFGTAIAGVPPVPGFTALTEAAQLDTATGSVPNLLDVLVGAEIMLGPLRPDPLSQPTGIRFHTVSAAAKGPLELDLLPGSAQLTCDERVDRKLSGNKLMNFASFLSARWRLNDWTWGRLDAACSLVDVVARPDRVRALNPADLLTTMKTLHQDLRREDPDLGDLIGTWPADVTEANICDRYRDLLTGWLHHNVLREELPLLKQLGPRPGTGDLPPSRATLHKAAAASATRLERADLALLGDIGKESIRELFKNRFLSRTTLRLALVAWRAVQPEGDRWARLVRAGFAVTKPLVVPSLAIGFIAPVGSLVATLFAWVAVAAAGTVWFNPPAHGLLAAGAAYATGCLSWHYWRRPQIRKPWLYRLILPAFAALAVLLGLGFGVLDRLTWQLDAPVRVLVTFLASSAAAAASLWWMPVKGGPRQRSFVALTALTAGLVPAAVVSALILGRVAMPATWLTATVLYAVLALETIFLTRWYPSPPGETAPTDRKDVPS